MNEPMDQKAIDTLQNRINHVIQKFVEEQEEKDHDDRVVCAALGPIFAFSVACLGTPNPETGLSEDEAIFGLLAKVQEQVFQAKRFLAARMGGKEGLA